MMLKLLIICLHMHVIKGGWVARVAMTNNFLQRSAVIQKHLETTALKNGGLCLKRGTFPILLI